ncbi:hypothetical protein FCM35_KLT06368 [Carex littledalei]|uniref:Uncharacterized protein n=1 Tax=Carex littledalei TaxID=544730 RepID=A0A833V7N5_9POAL|nr:hypothetical protein FCM35_KLT06368 [Carex littledalei]
MRVHVDSFIDRYRMIPLPVPDESMHYLQDAIHGEVQHEEVGEVEVREPLVSEEEFKKVHDRYLRTRLSAEGSFVCPVLPGLIRNEAFEISVEFTDLSNLMTWQCLDVSIIQIYSLDHWVLLVIISSKDLVLCIDSKVVEDRVFAIESHLLKAYWQYLKRSGRAKGKKLVIGQCFRIPYRPIHIIWKL